jgi:hypothetical protein
MTCYPSGTKLPSKCPEYRELLAVDQAVQVILKNSGQEIIPVIAFFKIGS